MKKLRKISFSILILLLAALLAVSGFMSYKDISERQKEIPEFEKLTAIVQESPNDVLDKKEAVLEPKQNKSEIFTQNAECVGWLTIPGTAVNYTVMHTPAYPQKYLRKNFYGKYSYCGVPFIDSRCSLKSENIIIYGHNMKNGTMFSDITKYRFDNYRKVHPIIEFETVEKIQRYIVVEVRQTNTSDEWYSQIGTEFENQFITLSTCYGRRQDGRILVVAESLDNMDFSGNCP